MEQEVSGEEQAVMAIKLADNVRELIRSEIRAALEDYGFVQNEINVYRLAQALMPNIISDPRFKDAVLNIIRAKINNTYYSTYSTNTVGTYR